MSQYSRSDQSKSNTDITPARPYQFAIDYSKRNGKRIGTVAIEPDFQPAKDWAYFSGIRQGRLPPVTPYAEGAVSPLWCPERGEPFCRGVRIELTDPIASEPLHCEVPLSYFNALAEKNSLDWVARGELAAGEQYDYHICAYPVAKRLDEPSDPSDAFHVEPLSVPMPITERSLQQFLDRSSPADPPAAGDLPLFIPRSVIEETRALATEAGDRETGGVLVGELHRDTHTPELFVEILAQIPAQYAESSGTSFSFTAQTWAAADAAIALRGRNEQIVGWWHSHPRFCNPACPEERQESCPLASSFFSGDDLHLHKVCFPQPHQMALLISDLPSTGSTPAIFGWRTGMVSARGYYVLP